MKYSHAIRFSSIALSLVAALCVAGAYSATPVQAASSEPVTGYAWSQYLGWIHFNGSNYGVTEDTSTGALSGYAWSSNLGWIDFSGVSVDLSTGALSGWAQACAAFADKNACSGTLDPNSGGWDGKIHLAGTANDGSSYGVTQDTTSCSWGGYAWGSDGIGAIHMSGSNYGVSVDSSLCTPAPTATLSASPSSIVSGQSSTLTWNSTNATSCSATGGFSTGGATSGTASVSPTSNATYGVTCTGSGGSANAYASVTVSNPSVSISANPTRVNSGSQTTLIWKGQDVSSCTVSGGTGDAAISVSGSADKNGDFTTGSGARPTITEQTTYTISCDGSTASVTVKLMPSFHEF